VLGVPGDVAALVDTSLAVGGSGFASRLYAAKWGDGKTSATSTPYFQESADFTDSLGTWTSGTGTIGNHYLRCTGDPGGRAYIDISQTLFSTSPIMVIGVCRTSDITSTSRAFLSTSDGTTGGVRLVANEEVVLSAANTWEVVNYGLINAIDVSIGTNTLTLEIDILQGASDTFDIDGVFAIPVTDTGYLISQISTYSGSPSTIFSFDLYGEEKVVRESLNDLKQSAFGNMWEISPRALSRLMFLFSATDNEYSIGITETVTLTITPRTSHLLGTI
jgi:hypothetical protein